MMNKWLFQTKPIMKQLTVKQKKILEFIENFFKKESYWPSIRQIQAQFGFKSTNAVMGHLKAIEQKECIRRIPGQARAFQLNHLTITEHNSQSATDIVSIPIFGSIAAGYPDRVESTDTIGKLQVDLKYTRIRAPHKSFALKVNGESMLKAGIFNGDLVVVEPGTPQNNDIVAALIDGETTLKRFVQPPNAAPYLKAENDLYPNLLPTTSLQIQGIVKSVIRSF